MPWSSGTTSILSSEVTTQAFFRIPPGMPHLALESNFLHRGPGGVKDLTTNHIRSVFVASFSSMPSYTGEFHKARQAPLYVNKNINTSTGD